jgi:copper transport protein
LAVVSDGFHVLGVGGWLGSLLVTIGVGVPAALTLREGQRGEAVADLINAYSPTALAFAALVAATGVVAGWIHVGSVAALWQSTYGRTLLVKLAILFVVAGTGAYNWLRVRPALGDVEGARRVRRSGSVELAAGAVVLIITAILVATPTPMDSTAMTR